MNQLDNQLQDLEVKGNCMLFVLTKNTRHVLQNVISRFWNLFGGIEHTNDTITRIKLAIFFALQS